MTASTFAALLDRSAAVLAQGARLAAILPPELHRTPAPGGGSVGAHLRHCIEFYRSLLAALEHGELDYDRRPRDTALEEDPLQAAAALNALVGALPGLAGRHPAQRLRVRHDCDHGEESGWARSSLRRELNFLLSHTVHHYALIALHLRQAGFLLPEEFGVSPATLRYRRERGAGAAA